MNTYKIRYNGESNFSFFIEAAHEVYHSFGSIKNLRSCNAKIYYCFDEKIAVLKSYDTIVALAYIPKSFCIDFSRIVRRERTTISTLPDMLPMPMANSRTTIQHISKFCKDLNITDKYVLYPTKDYPEYIGK